MRQGAHHGAQKSTRTGTLASRVISANAAASTSIGSAMGGKAVLQDPQRPVSERCFAGTRLFAPQVGHGRIMCTLKVKLPLAAACGPACWRCLSPARRRPVIKPTPQADRED